MQMMKDLLMRDLYIGGLPKASINSLNASNKMPIAVMLSSYQNNAAIKLLKLYHQQTQFLLIINACQQIAIIFNMFNNTMEQIQPV